MENVLLKDGQIVTISSNEDIVCVVRELCGDDLAHMIDTRLVDFDAEKLYAQALANTDAEAYLTSLERFGEVLFETAEVLEEISKYLEKVKRIDREVIYNKVVKLEQNIRHEM